MIIYDLMQVSGKTPNATKSIMKITKIAIIKKSGSTSKLDNQGLDGRPFLNPFIGGYFPWPERAKS